MIASEVPLDSGIVMCEIKFAAKVVDVGDRQDNCTVKECRDSWHRRVGDAVVE